MPSDASIPGHYPSQDEIDRANHVAVIVRLDVDDAYLQSLDSGAINRTSEELRQQLPRVVNETIDKLLPQNILPDFRSDDYRVGPATGGIADLAHVIVTLAEQSDQLTGYLDDVPIYYFYYRMAVETKRRVSDWVRDRSISGLHAVFAYTPEDLKLLAKGYVVELLDATPSGQVVIHCLTEEFYGGYQSPAHPIESLEYLVFVPVESGSYRFRVMGDSRILELVEEDEKGEHSIEALQYLDGEDDSLDLT